MKKFLLILVSTMLLIACKSKKNTAGAVATDNANLVLSFYSKGSGIDTQAKKDYFEYQEIFEKNNAIKLTTTRNAWGREGEVDYKIDLTQLSAKQRKKFTSGLKNKLKDKQVHFKEEASQSK